MPVETVDGERFTRDYAASTREKEIVAPPERKAAEEFVAEIRIIRHGITQGYSTDAGLTPMGGWQAHQRGHSLSKPLGTGQRVRHRLRRHQPGPADRRADPPRHARRA